MAFKIAFLALALRAVLVGGFAVRPKLQQARAGGSFEPPERASAPADAGPPGERDVIVKLYDISTPALSSTLSLLCKKPVRWFPKLTCSVGGRVWSYDGEIERTVDAIVESAAGGSPLRTWNLGATTLSDAQIDALFEQMGAADYNPEEYDFFYRNCNHFVDDASQRLSESDGVEREFMLERVLAESESLLVEMPGFQQSLTRGVTRQIQKIMILAWRREWKRALAEYDEAHPEGGAAGAVVVGREQASGA